MTSIRAMSEEDCRTRTKIVNDLGDQFNGLSSSFLFLQEDMTQQSKHLHDMVHEVQNDIAEKLAATRSETNATLIQQSDDAELRLELAEQRLRQDIGALDDRIQHGIQSAEARLDSLQARLASAEDAFDKRLSLEIDSLKGVSLIIHWAPGWYLHKMYGLFRVSCAMPPPGIDLSNDPFLIPSLL